MWRWFVLSLFLARAVFVGLVGRLFAFRFKFCRLGDTPSGWLMGNHQNKSVVVNIDGSRNGL